MLAAASSPDARESAIRVVIVDADHRVRSSVAEAVTLGPGLEVVGTASHLQSAVALIGDTRPDVVILDPRLPELDGGVALVSMIRRIGPSIRILLMSWSVENENERLAKGVDEIIDKCAPPDEFVEAIVAAAKPLAPARQSADARLDPRCRLAPSASNSTRGRTRA